MRILALVIAACVVALPLMQARPASAQAEIRGSASAAVPGELIQAHYQNRQWHPAHWRHRRYVTGYWQYWGPVRTHRLRPHAVRYRFAAYRLGDPRWRLGLYGHLGGLTDPALLKASGAYAIVGTVYFYQGVLHGKSCEVPADYLKVGGRTLGTYQEKLARPVYYLPKDGGLRSTARGPAGLPKGTADAFALDLGMPDSDTARPRRILCLGLLPDKERGGRLTRYVMAICYEGDLYDARAIAKAVRSSLTGHFDAGHSRLPSTPKVGALVIFQAAHAAPRLSRR